MSHVPMQPGHMQPNQQGQQMMYTSGPGGMVMSGGPERVMPPSAQPTQHMVPISSNPPQHMAPANYGPPGNSVTTGNISNLPTGHMPSNTQNYQVPSPMIPGPSPGYPQGPSPGGYSIPVSSSQSTGGSRGGADVAPSPNGNVSTGPPSNGPPAPANEATEDPAYKEKVADLQRFYDPLKKMLEEKGEIQWIFLAILCQSEFFSDQSHENRKFLTILDILENRRLMRSFTYMQLPFYYLIRFRRVTFEVLQKCEDVLKRLFEKVRGRTDTISYRLLIFAFLA